MYLVVTHYFPFTHHSYIKQIVFTLKVKSRSDDDVWRYLYSLGERNMHAARWPGVTRRPVNRGF